MTLEEMYERMQTFDTDIKLPEIKKFRQRVAHYVRVGQLTPAPKRIPREDGMGGTVGDYTVEHYHQLRTILTRIQGRTPTRERLGPLEAESEKQPQKVYGVSFWLPESLGKRIEEQVQAGHPISEQVWLGAKLFHTMPQGTQWEIFEAFSKETGLRRSREANQWQYITGLVVAVHLLERLNQFASQIGWVKPAEFLQSWRFDFEVTEGRVHVKKAYGIDPSGNPVEVAIHDE
ncbi:hypothetical protein D3C87_975980 [compost metagenome]